MQLVLSNNRVIAHGENFISVGGVVINNDTGAKYDNATIAECDSCPTDIDSVGYEYKAGVFTPCAPYGKGNNNGYFMEVCQSCAAPKNSGISIKGGLKKENLHPEVFSDVLKYELLWENEAPESEFKAQTIPLEISKYIGFVFEVEDGQAAFLSSGVGSSASLYIQYDSQLWSRTARIGDEREGVSILNGHREDATANNPAKVIPIRIYGVKL